VNIMMQVNIYLLGRTLCCIADCPDTETENVELIWEELMDKYAKLPNHQWNNPGHLLAVLKAFKHTLANEGIGLIILDENSTAECVYAPND